MGLKLSEVPEATRLYVDTTILLFPAFKLLLTLQATLDYAVIKYPKIWRGLQKLLEQNREKRMYIGFYP
jgi:hypothetical protein